MAACRSFGLDTGELDHLRPLLRLLGDVSAEVGRRAGEHGGAEVGEPRFNPGIGKASVDLPALAYAINSGTERGGSEGLTSKTSGTRTRLATGAMSRTK